MTAFPVIAITIADEIMLKQAKPLLLHAYTLLAEQTHELFFTHEKRKFILLLNFGVIVFFHCDQSEINLILSSLSPSIRKPLKKPIQETYHVVEAQKLQFEFDLLSVPKLDEHVIKNVMFNVAQSVALEAYFQNAESLLVDIRQFATTLEQTGTLDISKKNMRKFLGRALIVKNNVIENLYIFDEPEAVWDDEYLDAVNAGLVKFFNLKARFREIESTFKVIEDNLHVLMTLSHHKESSRLEWIIIVLILFEILYFAIKSVV